MSTKHISRADTFGAFSKHMIGQNLTCVSAYGNFTASKIYKVHNDGGQPYLINDVYDHVTHSPALFESTYTLEYRHRAEVGHNKVTQTGSNFTQEQMDKMTQDFLEPVDMDKVKAHINPVAKPIPKAGQVWAYISIRTGEGNYEAPEDMYYITKVEGGYVYHRSCSGDIKKEYCYELKRFHGQHTLVF